ncbi:hypothetical protein HNO92_000503 [Chromobacterium alkanivorans]|uniref:hypothetical protein n=1 Tax=Chromobacterium alkanivorans TaxID=1071719 RepID=UPI00216970F2|nr:hypothetical protein [Chromobacterium alkanivorans]MCS3802853.1 hypothetical protein [Chromobacterium alkanivorans]MCS3817179.1 hypothetical protein [Chromobacterium alkanivorans]MCS3872219.1 hypothetical protein [Chromobacterium alkanivorans]
MSQAWLDYQQAPPLWLPLAHMLAAPGWLLATTPLLAALPDGAPSRFLPEVLALTHMLALGVLGNAMLGSLWQLLAVTAGVAIPHPRRLLLACFLPLQAGCALLAAGFQLGLSPPWLQAGAALLTPALLTPALFGLRGLLRSPARDAGSRGLRLALCALVLAACLGAALVLLLSGRLTLPFAPLLDNHVLWAALGWLWLLLLSVSRTVIPMFLVTPPPAGGRLSREALLFGLLCLSSAALIWGAPALVSSLLAALGLLALWQGLRQLSALRRCQRRADPLRRGWQASLIWMTAAAPCAFAARLLPLSASPPMLAGWLWLGGFGLGAVLSMQGKILPFLAWLDLKQRGLSRKQLPATHELLGEAAHRRLLALHGVWVCCGLAWALGGLRLPLFAATLGLGLHWAGLAAALLRRHRAGRLALA